MQNRLNARTIALIALAILATAFTAMNYRTVVNVWPFGMRSILLVIVVAGLLGVGIGALAHSILGMLRPRSLAVVTDSDVIKPGERVHPGRP